MTKNDKLFIEHVKEQCKEYGVKCDLRPTKSVRISPKQKASGYFDEVNRDLVVSMKSKIALSILVHEYCHFTQWVEQCDAWVNGSDSYTKVNEWLEGKNVRDIAYHLGLARDLELDNEKRAVKMIQQWGISIDRIDYTKRANAYIQFYNYLLVTRTWCKPKNTPYNNKRLVAAMPGKFQMNYEVLDKKYLKIFVEEDI